MRSELTIGHEYVHLANCINGNMVSKYQEFAAYMWQAELFPESSPHYIAYEKQALKEFIPKENLSIFNNVVKPNYMNYSGWGLPMAF